jgi:hypothetical protein
MSKTTGFHVPCHRKASSTHVRFCTETGIFDLCNRLNTGGDAERFASGVPKEKIQFGLGLLVIRVIHAKLSSGDLSHQAIVEAKPILENPIRESFMTLFEFL